MRFERIAAPGLVATALGLPIRTALRMEEVPNDSNQDHRYNQAIHSVHGRSTGLLPFVLAFSLVVKPFLRHSACMATQPDLKYFDPKQ